MSHSARIRMPWPSSAQCTAISPSFDEIGKLAAIAAIRTLLNYFLNREIAQEQHEIELLDAAKRPADPPPAA